MGMTKALYQDFLDRAGIDPADDDALARFIVEIGGQAHLDKAFREFMEAQVRTPQIRMHKMEKIAQIDRKHDGDDL